MHGVRLTPFRIATFAREMSANVTGRDSSTLSRSIVFLRGGASPSSVSGVFVLSSDTEPENGRGVAMGYLNPVAARAWILARFDADFDAIDMPEDRWDVVRDADAMKERIMIEWSWCISELMFISGVACVSDVQVPRSLPPTVKFCLCQRCNLPGFYCWNLDSWWRQRDDMM